MQFGAEQVARRHFGFKADFFAEMASSLTTECVFLDGAAHSVFFKYLNFKNTKIIKMCFKYSD